MRNMEKTGCAARAVVAIFVLAACAARTTRADDGQDPFVVTPSSPEYWFDQEGQSGPKEPRASWQLPQWRFPEWSFADWEVSEGFENATRPVAGKLSLGTRIVAYSLTDPDGDFMGSIDHLDEDQDLMPTRFFADWLVSPYWGVELTWDRVRMSTVTTSDGHADGDIISDGPILTVFGRYPNDTKWTPFGGLGLAFLNGSFDSETWWRLHYASEDHWESVGRPSVALGGISKNLSVDDTIAVVLTGGADYRLTEHFSANIYARLMWGSVDAHYTILRYGEVTEDRGTHEFPIDNVALGAGITFHF